jgi:GTP1/Obg family GTP-binding protein
VCKEEKEKAENLENCSFGVMGEILKTLQREEEELEQTKTCLREVPAINTRNDQIEILKEINSNLKEIIEIQKAILEEVIKNRIE